MIEYVDADGVVLTREEYRSGLGKGRVRQVLAGFEDSRVDQSGARDADLNELVKRWRGGEPVPVFAEASFGDVSQGWSYQDLQEKLIAVERAFESLPAYVRERFRNSPVEFADAFADESRREELLELGLLEKVDPVVSTPEEPAKPPVEAAPVVPSGDKAP